MLLRSAIVSSLLLGSSLAAAAGPAAVPVKAVVKKGIVVVRSSRTNGGIVRRNIELNDDEAGTVASMELNPTKARVLLQLALLKTSDSKKIQDYFNRY